MINFNVNEAMQKIENLTMPAGVYNAFVSSAEMMQNKKGDGSYIFIKVKITDNQYKDNLVYDRIVYENKSDLAVAFGHKKLADLCGALNINSINNLNVLLGKPLQVSLAVQTSEYGTENKINGYLLKPNNQPMQPMQNNQSMQPMQNNQPQQPQNNFNDISTPENFPNNWGGNNF